MKNYIFLQILILVSFVDTLKPMNPEETPQKPFSLCKQVLTIDPDAPAADYKALAQRLHDAKLSTCECATYLVQEKKQKALRFLKKEGFLSEQGVKRINKLQNEIKKSNEEINDLVAEIPVDLPEDIKKEIVDHFSPKFLVHFWPTIDNKQSLGATTVFTNLPNDRKSLKKPLNYIKFYGSHLALNKVKDLSFFERKALFLHEEQHLLNRHGIIIEVLKREIQLRLHRSDYFPYNLFGKFSRAIETEADLVPTACGSCDDAYSAVKSIENLPKPPSHLPKNYRQLNYTHPSNITRYQRAQQIYKLKLAEEKLKQKEDPELL